MDTNKQNNIQEINEGEFQEKVINASNTCLILVDFWAPWCGPCKQLTPILEKIVNNANEKVVLVKINIDENQQIAGQLNIQSIPAVFAFKNGQPVDAFQGVIPEKKITEFIEKSLGEKLNEDHSPFYENVLELFSNKKFEDAKNILEDFSSNYPNELKAFGLYIDCLSSLENFKDAEIFIESLNDDVLKDKFVISAIKKMNIKSKNLKGPSIEDLLEKIKNDPKNIKSILKLSDKYFAENMIDESFSLLLINFKKDNDKIRSKFLEFFNALGNENPKTAEYRKKLSSLIFS